MRPAARRAKVLLSSLGVAAHRTNFEPRFSKSPRVRRNPSRVVLRGGVAVQIVAITCVRSCGQLVRSVVGVRRNAQGTEAVADWVVGVFSSSLRLTHGATSLVVQVRQALSVPRARCAQAPIL